MCRFCRLSQLVSDLPSIICGLIYSMAWKRSAHSELKNSPGICPSDGKLEIMRALGSKPAEVVHGPDERTVFCTISPPCLRTTNATRQAASPKDLRTPLPPARARDPQANGARSCVPPPNPAALRSNTRPKKCSQFCRQPISKSVIIGDVPIAIREWEGKRE